MASADYEHNMGDTANDYAVTLERDGAAVNLSTATGVVLRIQPTQGSGASQDFALSVTDAVAGQAGYDWSGGRPAGGAGTYFAQVRVTWSGGDIEIFPSDRAPYRYRFWGEL